jgi:uncharacterized protein DUF1302
MNSQYLFKMLSRFVTAVFFVSAFTSNVSAWNSKDGTLEVHGFLDSTTHARLDYGISKQRMRGQVEWSKIFKPNGLFSEISMHGTLRATYDGAYDLNDDEYGDSSGSNVFGRSSGLGNLETPWGMSPVSAGNPNLPGGGNFGFNLTTNPDTGLKRVSSELGNSNNNGAFGGGLDFYTPTRPCNVDSRGCLPGYMDATENELRFPEFTDDLGVLREIYIDATMPFDNGDEINFRVGRQQIVWGRTDLFRVLDVVNPNDFSIQNIYEELEDSRVPLGIFSAEYRAGGTGAFDDLNFQLIWNFEKFRPNNLGQGGQPYNILLAGDLFRALGNCWQNGCTVSNFATGLVPGGNLSTDFPAHMIGIRNVNLPKWKADQGGFRIEGVFKSVGFSFNVLSSYSQLPSLRGGIPTTNGFVGTTIPAAGCPVGFPLCPLGFNPFDPTDVPNLERLRGFEPAFDVHFPRVNLIGGSADFYVDPLKSAFRVEVAHTSGEEFADTSKRRLFSESNVLRWVVGWDRQTYIRALNPNRTFLLSAQIFGQHILDHKDITTPFGTQIGYQDHKDNFIGTFLFQGFYMNDRLLPRVITAYDIGAQAGVIAPAIDWLVNDNWRVTFGGNFKFGTGHREADDARTSNSFPPFTAGPACNPAAAGGPTPGCFPGGGEFSSIGIRRGFEPLGRFKSGPIGMAQHEDEIQLLVRYRF